MIGVKAKFKVWSEKLKFYFCLSGDIILVRCCMLYWYQFILVKALGVHKFSEYVRNKFDSKGIE